MGTFLINFWLKGCEVGHKAGIYRAGRRFECGRISNCLCRFLKGACHAQKSPYNGRPWRAGIAQLVEHNLAMVRVASSSLVSRSRLKLYLFMRE